MSVPAQTVHADHLPPADFAKIAALIGSTVGIKLPPEKRLMVEGRLRKRFREAGASSRADYCEFVFEGGGLESELVHLIDAITTNKTDFFREAEHLNLLERELAPALLSLRGRQDPLLKIWSAASSNGAEAWTIAMVLEDLLEKRGDFRYAILGTDISTQMLEDARRAIYTEDVVAPVPETMRRKYIRYASRPGRNGEVRIAPHLRKRVSFERLNLMDATYPYDHDVDVIFLRNVLIYFKKSDQESVISRLFTHLRPKGYLIVGHSESMVVNTSGLRQVGPAVFQKI
jgi:chemotaxis protein methyltransferase CheR